MILGDFGRRFWVILNNFGQKINFGWIWLKMSIWCKFDHFWPKKLILGDMALKCRFWMILTIFCQEFRLLVILVENVDLGWFWTFLVKISSLGDFGQKMSILGHWGQMDNHHQHLASLHLPNDDERTDERTENAMYWSRYPG